MTRSRKARGFTLIEVLIALAIVAIALASAMRAVGSVATGTQALHARLLAGWSADNRLTELHLQHAWPAFGVTSYACPQGNVALTCIQTVTATPNPLFRRIEVSVRSPDTGTTLLADLVTVVADETRRSL
jgi:general secretion pathway protein I